MKISSETHNDLYFLSGGGEMGEITRSFDWSKTSIGTPDQWPQSLRTTLGTLLHSAFPMFLFWGEELICFYNDAFRPSLGIDGKHPSVGKKGIEVWAEIWEFIGPLITQVMATTEPVWFEDQLVPFYRNGKIEDIYWTFSYSPVYGDDGKVNGVFVTCVETTDKVKIRKELEESEARFRTMAEGTDILIAISDETSNAIYFNRVWGDLTGRSVKDLLNFGWADLIHEEDKQGFVDLYLSAFEKKQPWKGEFRILNKNGAYRWLLAEGTPRMSSDESFAGYISSSIDITDYIIERKKTEEAEEKARLAIDSANLGVYEIVYANNEMSTDQRFKQIWGFDKSAKREQYAEVIHPDDLLQRELAHKTSLVSGQLDYNARVIWKDNSVHWVRVTGKVIYDSKKNPIKLIGIAQDITDTVTAQQKIEESVLQMKSMVESAPFAIGVYIGKEMRVEFANKTILDIWGKGSDVIGRSFSDVLPELDNQEVFKQLDGVYTTGKPFHIYNQRLDLVVDNALRPYYFNYSLIPLFDSKGKVYGVMNTGVDLTDLNFAKLALQKSEENLRSTILQAPVAMCIFKGPDHVVELANERMFELWGRPSEDILNKPIFEGLPEAKDQGFEALLNGVYNTGKTFSAQGVPISLPRNGTLENIYVNFLYEAYREADGSVSGVLAVAMDVSAQITAQKVVESAYERFLTLSEAMPQIVWTATSDGNLDYFSKQWWAYSGLNFQQSVGSGWAITIHEEDLPQLIQTWTHCLKTGDPYAVEARVKRADGIYRWFIIRALALKEDGKITQWIGTNTDIEDQKVSEHKLQYMSSQLSAVNEELAASNEELSERSYQLAAVNEELYASNEELSESTKQLAAVNEELAASNEELGESNLQLKLINSDLDNFIYTASHDLKAPIANIEGLMINLKDFLPAESENNEEANLVTSLIDASIERFKKTINQLTDITKLQTEYNQNATEVELRNALDEVRLDLQFLIEQSNATVEIDGDIDQTIYFSFKNLRSIIYNLLSNAIKYRSKERAPHIHVSCVVKNGYQILSVSDNGLGIDLSQETKLFAIFGRLHDHVEGSGVGLYIVKKMVENAGGKIEVESKVGVGSTFRIYFKIVKQSKN